MTENSKIKIIFWGTPHFAREILKQLAESGWKPILVITQPDKAGGRGLKLKESTVKALAKKLNIPYLQPTKLKDPDFIQKIKSYQPDLCVLAAYGKIIPKEILAIPPKGFLNVHPSLLPRWRGASPIQAAILNGDKETGVTIILMDEEMDHGDIVANSKLKSQISKLSYKEFEEKLIGEASKLLIETLPQWLDDKITPTPQNHSKATFCPMIKKEDGRIDWHEPAEKIERKIRAFQDWPVAFLETNGKRIKILEADVLKNETILKDKKIGEFFCFNKELAVKCGEDTLIIKKIQPESKKEMSGYEFWCGYQRKLKI